MVNQLRIEVRLPEGHWSIDVSRQRPEAILRIEETMPAGGAEVQRKSRLLPI